MRRILHLTNGSSVIPLMREAGVEGPIVPWDDVLHEGPVPSGLGTAALRERRADFLASSGWAARDAIVRDLTERDAVLDNLARLDEIVLWFEHDLYDQLQLLQILDRLSMDIPPRVTAVPDDRYLTSLPTSEFHALFGARRVVTSGERSAARDAWIAFRSDDPRGLVDVLPRVTILPHMAPALKRHLEQFPSLENGLSRTEQQTFEVMAAGDRVVRDIYLHANHDREEAVFMGDAAFLFHISALFKSPRPLLRSLSAGRGSLELDDQIELTDDGHRVLSGELDRITVHGIDRWLGGVHLRGQEPLWRWDRTRQVIRLA